MILPGIAPTYVLLCPRISASSFTPPRHIRTYSLLSDCATERAILVFPVPGGPTRQIIGASASCDTLEIEVNVLGGKPELILTGNMGDVMRESAQIALSYVRSVVRKNQIFEENAIHIHIPEGAVPKDGPSAGITMATAIYSAVTGKPVDASTAMTGEVTLRGRVMPIGGLKEKLLAAKTAGLKRVLVPLENKSDVEELEEEIVQGLEIVYVSDMKEVLKLAIVK